MIAVRLFHGRRSPDEELDDWGIDGPVLGPLDGVHSTYLYHIRMVRDGETLGDLAVDEDMYYYGGIWYGDMVVISYTEAQEEFSDMIEDVDFFKCKNVISNNAKELADRIRESLRIKNKNNN